MLNYFISMDIDVTDSVIQQNILLSNVPIKNNVEI